MEADRADRSRYERVVWTLAESASRNRRHKPLLAERGVTASMALAVALRTSSAGAFIAEFNGDERSAFVNRNKYETTMYDRRRNGAIAREDNRLTDDLLATIDFATARGDAIDLNFCRRHFRVLRLNRLHIDRLDDGLLRFRALKVLTLAGNRLAEAAGELLPANVQFLELFGNAIGDVAAIAVEPPTGLLHVGLGRNRLTDASNCHLLSACGCYDELRSLDLSHNEIRRLPEILRDLRGLKRLACLSLEGNPCYVCRAYKSAITKNLSQLRFLDKVELLENDREAEAFDDEDLEKGELTFTCHRIMGLPAPKKEKGFIQCYRFELDVPLLEDLNATQEYSDSEDDAVGGKSKKKGKGTDKKAKKGDRKSKASEKKSPYDAPDEYADEKRRRAINTSIKSERFVWTKQFRFADEFVVIPTPDNELVALRDTLGSRINCKLIYYKIAPPAKAKKEKKPKGKGKKDKKDEKQESRESRPPKEKIVQKVTLASFYCDLRDINWSDKTIDYYWTAHPDLKSIAVPMEGSLKAVAYVERKRKPQTKKKDADEEQTDLFETVPDRLTVEIGFGLKRTHGV